ncbi:Protein-tyrosine phosphatase [Candidatus Sulfopaludibacter sp. SbA3]|nr:Protein-tyrosine phosphatase [Candidatus Sulfopaludibacter sp. SbA3]
MYTPLYWLEGPWPGRLAISARPRGGDWLADEMKSWRSAGVGIVVSLLTADEIEDLALQDESLECRKSGIEFISFPIVDRSAPASEGEAVRLIERLDRELDCGLNVVVHCRQGVGRSGLIAASLLVLRGSHPSEAMDIVSTFRGAIVPETAAQENWIVTFASTKASP